MEISNSFLTFSLWPYGIGFLGLCFWWRWWLLLPVGAVAAAFAAWEYDSVMRADGPGIIFGLILFLFLVLGAGSGAVASALIILGRALRWRMLEPIIVLPSVFLLGFGSFFAFSWAEQQTREARYAAPSEACLSGLHPAKLGDVDLMIPVAPGIFLWGANRDDEHYLLWSNPHARAFCEMAEANPVELKRISFMLDGMPSGRDGETKKRFCSVKRAEYPWADMACNRIATEAIPDSPVKVEVHLVKGKVDWIAKERDAMKRNPVSIAQDGLRTYRDKDDLYLERADGYFARCQATNSSNRPWLYCSASERLSGDLTISYHFRSTQSLFLAKSPIIAANARAIFDSLKR